jgi:hypothetical protein
VALLAPEDRAAALWVTVAPEYQKHEWGLPWICSHFRNEGVPLLRSSDLIRQAISVTLYQWQSGPPADGMVTFVDEEAVRPKRDPGYCFLKAGPSIIAAASAA